MPTAKPRITVTLEPRIYDVLHRLSKAGGESMSKIITDFLGVAVPPMERMASLIEQANQAPKNTLDELAASLARAESQIVGGLVKAQGEIDKVSSVLEDALSVPDKPRRGAQRAPQAAPKGEPTPVPVTRGSGRTKTAKSGVTSGFSLTDEKSSKKGLNRAGL